MKLLVKAFVERERHRGEGDTLRAGLIASAIYNTNRKKGGKIVKPHDFLPKRQLTPEEQRQKMLAWATGKGGNP